MLVDNTEMSWLSIHRLWPLTSHRYPDGHFELKVQWLVGYYCVCVYTVPCGKRLQYITMENQNAINGKTRYKWPFSIAFGILFTRG